MVINGDDDIKLLDLLSSYSMNEIEERTYTNNKNNTHSIALFQHNKSSSSSAASSIDNVNDHEMINVVNDLLLWNINKDNKKYFDDSTIAFDQKQLVTNNNNNEKEEGLYLVCLDNNYILYFYKIKSLLSSTWSNNNANTNNNDISEGENYDMERLFVGNTMMNNVNTTIGPLSNPNNVVHLSSFHNSLQETKSKLLHHNLI